MAGGRPRRQNQGLPSRVYLKSGSLYYVHKDNRWENIGKDISRAREIAASFNSSAPLSGTISYWLTEWLKELSKRVAANDLAARTQMDYIDAVDKLNPFFGKMDPGAVKKQHIAEYLDIGRELNRSVRANREKSALSSFFTWLIRNGITESNPCNGITRNKETKRDRWITDSEYNKVFDIAGPAVRCWMILLYRTLQRPSDIIKWKHDQITINDNGERVLKFRQSKTRRLMSIILNSEIENALVAVASTRSKSSNYLIPSEAGQSYTEGGISSMFRRHVVDSKVKNFAPYDLKAKGATDLFKDGVSLEVISQLCGHTSTRTTEIYIKSHSPESVRANSRVVKRTVNVSNTPEL